MIQDLPYRGFKFLSEEEIKKFDLDSISENSTIGYVLEVNLVRICIIYTGIIHYVLKKLK